VTRANKSGISLSPEDVSIAKGMLLRGDRQHDIAAWFGVNGGRVAEISTRQKHAEISISRENLPPQGPYLSGKDSSYAHSGLFEVRERISAMIKDNKTTQMDVLELRGSLKTLLNDIDIVFEKMEL